jgi:hypothetical protein
MKNLNINKEKNVKKNLNIKIGQYNTNNKIHKKSESLGSGKIKIKRNIGDNNNFNSNYKTNMNNYIKNSIQNNNNKNTPLSKNTNSNNNINYNSKSYNRKDIKINNALKKDNQSAKSTKNFKNSEKPNLINKNISVNKKKFIKHNINNKYESQIRLYNEGNMTTVHKKQKSLINFNALNEKTHRNNNKMNKANNLLHSVDLVKNEVNTFYHNENFPFLKQSIINNSGLSTKNQKNRNKFLKTHKIDNIKGSYSSSIEANQNKINFNDHSNGIITKDARKQQNNININNNNFNYIKKKNNNKFLFNRTLQQEKEKKSDYKNDKKIIERNNNNNRILNDIININNNSAININNHPNLNTKLDMTTSCQINQRSESMKNLNEKSKDIPDNKKNKNNINYQTTKRPKTTNIFKYLKDTLAKKNEIKGNMSGKNAKNIRSIKYDINEILERRGIAKTNRAKDLKGGFKYNLNNNYIYNYANNGTNRNKNNTIKRNNENYVSIKTKDY